VPVPGSGVSINLSGTAIISANRAFT